MKSYCLASSSSGNCFILTIDVNGIPTNIMIECGIPLSEIYSKLSENNILMSSVKCCLITHAHQDHCKSAKELQRLNIPIYAHKDTLKAINIKGNELILNKPNRLLNGLFVMPFEVEHDIMGAVGFIIKTAYETIIFVNDHKRWTENLINFKPNYVFIECNYDHKIVYTQLAELKKQKNNEILTDKELFDINNKIRQNERNINSHCSLNGTIKGLKKLDLSHCQAIFLMHLSDRYANEYKMKETIKNEFGIKTYVCKKKGGIK